MQPNCFLRSLATLLMVFGISAPAIGQSGGEAEFNAGAQAYADGDKEAAVAAWEEAAAEGNVGAAWVLGNIYEVGDGVAQSDGEAVHYYRLAAEAGHPGAQTRLGLYNKYGSDNADLERNDEKALEWFEAAALQRYAEAQYQLALMYREGRGVTASPSESRRWLLLAANKRHVPSLLTLSEIYFDGLGVEPDPAKGWMYLTLANNHVDPTYAVAVNEMTQKYANWTREFRQQDARAEGEQMAAQWEREQTNPAPPAN